MSVSILHVWKSTRSRKTFSVEVIATDPDFKESTMFNGGGEIPQTAIPQQQVHQSRRRAQVKIVEQPASKALRFRYECEGRSAGSIPGASSTPENKTFPSIQVVGYKGRAVVVVSCVTKDEPYRPHPHNLVGREGCKKGVCTMEISPDTMCVTFSNLGIQCVKKKDIENALRVREEIKVDPFMSKFECRCDAVAD
jgi:c-Rel proto-oncogene protein